MTVRLEYGVQMDDAKHPVWSMVDGVPVSRFLGLLGVGALVLSALGGCAAPIVYTTAPPAQTSVSASGTSQMLVAIRLMRPAEVSVTRGSARAAAVAAKEELAAERARRQAFVDTLVIELTTAFRRAGVTVALEADAGSEPLPLGSRLLRIDLRDVLTITDKRMGVVTACVAFGTITAGLAYLACIGARNEITQTARVDVRLYDVSRMTSERLEHDGEFTRALDTSAERPALTGVYSATITSGRHVMSRPSGGEALAFAREQGDTHVAADL